MRLFLSTSPESPCIRRATLIPVEFRDEAVPIGAFPRKHKGKLGRLAMPGGLAAAHAAVTICRHIARKDIAMEPAGLLIGGILALALGFAFSATTMTKPPRSPSPR
ncbi:MAG: hypothetical protein Q4615_06680 [Paracoccus aminovorans]|nr:hypothetical protein [Paracoccus aminovorans]